MTYIFGKTNDSELFEDVTLTVKNIGLALRTVAGDDSLRNAWTKDGNLVTFVNGQLKPIGQENHSKFVYKGAYSRINNQTRENYTDSCIAPETPFKTQGKPSSLALFRDSDGSSSSRWADGTIPVILDYPFKRALKGYDVVAQAWVHSLVSTILGNTINVRIKAPTVRCLSL